MVYVYKNVYEVCVFKVSKKIREGSKHNMQYIFLNIEANFNGEMNFITMWSNIYNIEKKTQSEKNDEWKLLLYPMMLVVPL